MNVELEIKAEEEEARRRAREQQRAEQRVRDAYVHAFQSGRSGKAHGMREVITQYALGVNAREKAPAPAKGTDYETMLHVAAAACDSETIRFLLDKGQSFGRNLTKCSRLARRRSNDCEQTQVECVSYLHP